MKRIAMVLFQREKRSKWEPGIMVDVSREKSFFISKTGEQVFEVWDIVETKFSLEVEPLFKSVEIGDEDE